VLQFADVQVITTGLLAEGGYSFVYSAREVASHPRLFAVKKVLAQDNETREVAETELSLLKTLSGEPGFVRCYGSYIKEVPSRGASKRKEYYMLLEYASHGSLVDLIYKRSRGGEYERKPHLPQERLLSIFAGIVSSVAHMHALDPPVAHRDLKLENVLATAKDRFVLCDFGSATTRRLTRHRTRKQVIEEEERIDKYSTLMYRAPEMCDLYRNQEVGTKADVWALGCILYCLCFREHPFNGESTLPILNGAWSIPADSKYSASVHELIKAMLTSDPALRPSSAQVLQRVRNVVEGGAGASGGLASPSVSVATTAVCAASCSSMVNGTSHDAAACIATCCSAADGAQWEATFEESFSDRKPAGAGFVGGESSEVAPFEADFTSAAMLPLEEESPRFVVLQLLCDSRKVIASIRVHAPAAVLPSAAAAATTDCRLPPADAWASFAEAPAPAPVLEHSETEFGDFEAAGAASRHCTGGREVDEFGFDTADAQAELELPSANGLKAAAAAPGPLHSARLSTELSTEEALGGCLSPVELHNGGFEEALVPLAQPLD